MSNVFTFTEKSPILSFDFNPPIVLDDDVNYVMGLTFFQTFNSVPNIIEGVNSDFYYGTRKIRLPTGAYELESIRAHLLEKMKPQEDNIILRADPSTLKCYIKCTAPIDFTKPNTIRDILGFKSKKIPAGITERSDSIVNITNVNAIFIDCNITLGTYDNGKMSHYIHHFFPESAPGWKIIECPDNVIYLPINTKTITNITLKIVDQDGKLIDFRDETITIGLHLKAV